MGFGVCERVWGNWRKTELGGGKGGAAPGGGWDWQRLSLGWLIQGYASKIANRDLKVHTYFELQYSSAGTFEIILTTLLCIEIALDNYSRIPWMHAWEVCPTEFSEAKDQTWHSTEYIIWMVSLGFWFVNCNRDGALWDFALISIRTWSLPLRTIYVLPPPI